jgi:hypothetical protein
MSKITPMTPEILALDARGGPEPASITLENCGRPIPGAWP